MLLAGNDPFWKLEFLSGFGCVGNDSQFQTIGVQHCGHPEYAKSQGEQYGWGEETEHSQTGSSQTQYRLDPEHRYRRPNHRRDTRLTFGSAMMFNHGTNLGLAQGAATHPNFPGGMGGVPSHRAACRRESSGKTLEQ